MSITEKIVANQNNRYVISPSVKKYIKGIISEYPSLWNKLKELRSQLANDYHCLC